MRPLFCSDDQRAMLPATIWIQRLASKAKTMQSAPALFGMRPSTGTEHLIGEAWRHYVIARSFFGKGVLALLCQFFMQSVFMQSIHAAEQRAVRSLLEIRRQQVVIQQFDLSCGAAALATLLRYQYGDPVSEHDIATALMRRDAYLADPDLIRQQEGFSLLDLKRIVQRRGYEGTGYGGMQLDDLVRQAPLIVPINLYGYQHFVIFRGRVGNQVMLADPAWGNRTMRSDDFLHAWIADLQHGGIGFLVLRRNHEPVIDPAENRMAPRADDVVLFK